MSFQGYLDTIKAKTGKVPADFRALAEQKGLLAPGVKTAELVSWLKEDFGLGHGHAMAIVATLGRVKGAGLSADEKVDAAFAGKKAPWRPVYEELLAWLSEAAGVVEVAPTSSYVSLLKGKKKFAIVQATADRLDLGIKLKGVEASGRLEEAGSWNAMVTHRVRVRVAEELDAEVREWLRQAYDAA